MSGKKVVKDVLRMARKLKYSIQRLKNNHFLIKGNGSTFCVASTPRSTDSIHAIKNQILRLGINVEPSI